jgi:hypothetical protein
LKSGRDPPTTHILKKAKNVAVLALAATSLSHSLPHVASGVSPRHKAGRSAAPLWHFWPLTRKQAAGTRRTASASTWVFSETQKAEIHLDFCCVCVHP